MKFVLISAVIVAVEFAIYMHVANDAVQCLLWSAQIGRLHREQTMRHPKPPLIFGDGVGDAGYVDTAVNMQALNVCHFVSINIPHCLKHLQNYTWNAFFLFCLYLLVQWHLVCSLFICELSFSHYVYLVAYLQHSLKQT